MTFHYLHKHDIKLLWNAQGITYKLGDNDFLNSMVEHDINYTAYLTFTFHYLL